MGPLKGVFKPTLVPSLRMELPIFLAPQVPSQCDVFQGVPDVRASEYHDVCYKNVNYGRLNNMQFSQPINLDFSVFVVSYTSDETKEVLSADSRKKRISKYEFLRKLIFCQKSIFLPKGCLSAKKSLILLKKSLFL